MKAMQFSAGQQVISVIFLFLFSFYAVLFAILPYGLLTKKNFFLSRIKWKEELHMSTIHMAIILDNITTQNHLGCIFINIKNSIIFSSYHGDIKR